MRDRTGLVSSTAPNDHQSKASAPSAFSTHCVVGKLRSNMLQPCHVAMGYTYAV